MGLEKTTHISTDLNGRIVFSTTGSSLKLEILSSDNVVLDTAELGEDDLRTLLKDSFPAKKRGPRAADTAGNSSRKKKSETHASA